MPKDRISLQILFQQLPKFGVQELYDLQPNVSHRALAIKYQLPEDTTKDGEGFAETPAYKMKLSFVNGRLDAKDEEQICGHIRLLPDAIENIQAHGAYIELSVEPNPAKPLEAYRQLLFLGAMIAAQRGLIIANVNGFTSFTAAQILSLFGDMDWLEAIEDMPPLFLFSGPVIHEFDNNEMLWMRSYGNHLLGIADLGTAISSQIVQEYVPMTLEVFDNIMSYMIESGNKVEPGHTMESESVMISVRDQPAQPDEFFYQSPTGMLRIDYTPKPGLILPRF